MDVLKRISTYMERLGMSNYKLALAAGLSESTVANFFSRKTVPTVDTLQKICNAFGITLAEFFADGKVVVMDANVKKFLEARELLTPGEQKALLVMMKDMGKTRKDLIEGSVMQPKPRSTSGRKAQTGASPESAPNADADAEPSAEPIPEPSAESILKPNEEPVPDPKGEPVSVG